VKGLENAGAVHLYSLETDEPQTAFDYQLVLMLGVAAVMTFSVLLWSRRRW
jgi:hypothetical protein